MAENSKIEWTDHTFNPWIGCTKVSPGCDNCYAERDWDLRKHRAKWGPGNPRSRTGAANWKKPLQWNAGHQDFLTLYGRRCRVFCASLADVFDNEVIDEWRVDLFRLIAATPSLDWLLLTKRIGNAAKMIHTAVHSLIREEAEPPIWPWPNVWLGATVVNQEEADRDIPKLLAVPARVRFLSMEPLLGPIDLRRVRLPAAVDGPPGPIDPPLHLNSLTGDAWLPSGRSRMGPCRASIDWVIVGGESGPNARPMHPDWARSLRDQCKAAGVPFHFKQWGEWLPWTQFSDSGIDDPPEQTRFQTAEWNGETWGDVGRPMWCDSKDGLIDDEQCVGRVGKKAAGRLLDGVTHDGYPVLSRV